MDKNQFIKNNFKPNFAFWKNSVKIKKNHEMQKNMRFCAAPLLLKNRCLNVPGDRKHYQTVLAKLTPILQKIAKAEPVFLKVRKNCVIAEKISLTEKAKAPPTSKSKLGHLAKDIFCPAGKSAAADGRRSFAVIFFISSSGNSNSSLLYKEGI